jgi:hypothetical protein
MDSYSGSKVDTQGKVERLIARYSFVLKPAYISNLREFVMVRGAGTYFNAIYHPPLSSRGKATNTNHGTAGGGRSAGASRIHCAFSQERYAEFNGRAGLGPELLSPGMSVSPVEVTLVVYGYSDVVPEIGGIYADIRSTQGRRGVQSRALIGVMWDTPEGIAPGKLSRYLGSCFPVIVRSRLEAPPVPRLNPMDYQLDPQRLCSGGWGVVHRAHHARTSATVAMKFFGYLKEPCLSAIRREIELMRCLAGLPGVIKLFGTFDEVAFGYFANKKYLTSFPVIVMELVQGGNLLTVMGERLKTLNERAIADIFKGMIEGLRGIHSRGYIHRDIKLQNVMVSGDNVVKIIDFGLMIPAPPKDTGGSGIVRLEVAAGTLGK